ncbi:transposase [Citreicella sp. SE45]|nr:transposase [Citreicella sp. SE45]
MALSRDLGVSPKTVAKWRKRETVGDRETGPKTQPNRQGKAN